MVRQLNQPTNRGGEIHKSAVSESKETERWKGQGRKKKTVQDDRNTGKIANIFGKYMATCYVSDKTKQKRQKAERSQV